MFYLYFIVMKTWSNIVNTAHQDSKYHFKISTKQVGGMHSFNNSIPNHASKRRCSYINKKTENMHNIISVADNWQELNYLSVVLFLRKLWSGHMYMILYVIGPQTLTWIKFKCALVQIWTFVLHSHNLWYK